MKAKVESPGKIFAQSYTPHNDNMRMVSVKIDYELYQKLVEYARRNEKPMTHVIREALREFLDKR
jgi:metal-responsive CopG/Arc/MetJ family transcriptional regulator